MSEDNWQCADNLRHNFTVIHFLGAQLSLTDGRLTLCLQCDSLCWPRLCTCSRKMGSADLSLCSAISTFDSLWYSQREFPAQFFWWFSIRALQSFLFHS